MARIIIVDDHKLFLEGFSLLVAGLDENYNVETHVDPVHFTKNLDQAHGVDLLICDLMMSVINGITLISAFRKKYPRVPVLVLSGTPLKPPINELKKLKVKGFLHKSVEIDEVRFAISQLLQGKTYFDDNMDGVADMTDGLTQHADPEFAEVPKLSQRQTEVLHLIGQGASNKVIAKTMSISENTVKTYIKQLFQSFGANTRTSCVRRAQQMGFL